MSAGRLFLIAGELSGDRLGAALMQGLCAHGYEFEGIGGPAMSAMGLQSRFDMQELSLMGVVEILPSIPRLLRRIRQTADAIIANPPEAIITIDSPDFCLRVLKRVRKHLPDIKTVHYVAPSVWAWRPERAKKMAPLVDHVLALLPFEPPYMQKEGMGCDFVGHPVVDEPLATVAQRTDFIDKYRLNANDPMLVFLPGSRRSELKYLGGIYHATLTRLIAAKPNLQILLPLASGIAPAAREKFSDLEAHITYIDPDQDWEHGQGEKRTAYALGDGALATSGTVALELGAHGCPMVIAYRSNKISERMYKRVMKIDTANLINLLNDTHEIPEYLFEDCTPDNLCGALLTLLQDQQARQRQRDAMSRAMSLLGRDRAARKEWAANSVLSFLKQADKLDKSDGS